MYSLLTIDDSMPTLKINNSPSRNLILTHEDGRKATIDFSGDSVIYSGDLPVEESAKIFFEAFRGCWEIE